MSGIPDVHLTYLFLGFLSITSGGIVIERGSLLRQRDRCLLLGSDDGEMALVF
jgi:hypothetical protein